MSAENSGQDLSIEEILASIRQIISDDEDDSTADSSSENSDDVFELTERVDEGEGEGDQEKPDSKPVSKEDISDDHNKDSDQIEEPRPQREIEPETKPEPVPEVVLAPKEDNPEIDMIEQPLAPDDSDEGYIKDDAHDEGGNDSVLESVSESIPEDSILTSSAASAALEGFAALASHAALDRKGTGATTIEDVVRELMKPMLREWLDANLPPLIEKVVQEELQRVARKVSDRD